MRFKTRSHNRLRLRRIAPNLDRDDIRLVFAASTASLCKDTVNLYLASIYWFARRALVYMDDHVGIDLLPTHGEIFSLALSTRHTS